MLRWRLTVPSLIRRLTGTLGAARQTFRGSIPLSALMPSSAVRRLRDSALQRDGWEAS